MYIVRKKISGKEYFYLNKAVREDGKVKSKNVAYLGKSREEAEKKAKEIIENLNKISNAVIVHGSNSSEKEAKEGLPENERHWKPWLKKELEKQGIKVSNELYPEDWMPDYNKWKKVFDKNKIDENTILIGHSAGTAFLLRWLSENKRKVKELILIAPSVIKDGKYLGLSKLKDFQFDSSLKSYFNKLIIFYSDNDDEDIIKSAKKIHEILDGELIDLKNKGHFTLEDMGTEEFPELLQKVNESLKTSENKQEVMKAEKIETKKEVENKYEKLIELASKKSIFYPAAEIYPNSPSGFWDFGPVGNAIRRKIVNFWRHELVQKENMLEIHGSQILPAAVFEGSGHLKSFADPIVQCTKCKKFERADKLISEKINENVPESLPIEKLDELIKKHNVRCPKCGGELGKVSKFNMMVETIVGKQGEFKTFLRPEACQSIFLNFQRMAKTMRLKLPQGIAQVGGAFRNEISPRQSITRSVEFSQMEAEIFFDSRKINEIENFDEIKDYKLRILFLGKKEVEEVSAETLVNKKLVPGKLIAYFLARTQQVWNKLGIPLEKIRFREVAQDERAFYSLATFDFEVETSLGWLELIANNYRTDYDLKNHMEHSGTNLEYIYETGERIIPHIWEISAGVDRTMFAILDNSLKEGKEGLYFSIPAFIAPYDCAVLPLVNKEGMPELARKIEKMLKEAWFDVFYDSGGSIGRRYARMDEVGTMFCITIDGESLKNNDVTIRNRDNQKQVRIKIDKIKEILRKLINSEIKFEELK